MHVQSAQWIHSKGLVRMPSKTIYCKECKGYGETYHQTIERYGDQRIKGEESGNKSADMCVVKCIACGGTGYIEPKARKRPDWVGIPLAQRAGTKFVVAVEDDTEETETALL